jgi:hypothetical protein
VAMKKGGKKYIIYVVSNSYVISNFYLQGVCKHSAFSSHGQKCLPLFPQNLTFLEKHKDENTKMRLNACTIHHRGAEDNGLP